MKYATEFKLDAIRLLEAGTKPGHEIERDLGLGSGEPTAERRWRRYWELHAVGIIPGSTAGRVREHRRRRS
jgi:hypothetical protein